MKALVYTAPGRVEMHEMDVPQPGNGEALVRVQAAGICGSDMGGFLGHHARRQPPLVLGHEVVGVVEESMNASFSAGQRVCVNPIFSCHQCSNCLAGRQNVCTNWRLLGMDDVEGAFADFVLAPYSSLTPLPAELPDEIAVLPEPVACGVHLLSLAGGEPFGSMAIFGAGTQGTLILCLAKALGYHPIFISDVNPERLAVAEKLGSSRTIHAAEVDALEFIREETGENGVDIAIDAVGLPKTRLDATEACRPGGTVLLLGLAEATTEMDFLQLIRREIRLQTSFGYNATDFQKAVDLVVNGSIDIQPWIEVRPLEDGQAAFDKMIEAPGGTVKMVLKP